MDNVALLIIDMQDSFLDVIPSGQSVLRRTEFAIQSAQLLDIPCIFTLQCPDKLGGLTKRLEPHVESNANVFIKSDFSALQEEGVREHLEKTNVGHLLVGGVETTICVYQTAIQALALDMGVTLLSDCIGARREADERAVFAELQGECHRLPSETVFYSTIGGADHPKFREFTQYVKEYS